MDSDLDKPRWSPRVPKWKIRRLYESDAKGILDEDLLEDVGWSLLLRCQDILTVDEAKRGRVRCPRCAEQGAATIIRRETRSAKLRCDEVLVCPVCGWQISWDDYASTYKCKQLNAGGATQAFAGYMKAYLAARTAREKMLAIDRLIHEFHYSARVRPDQPTRPVAVNLIQGRLRSALEFLDELSGLPPTCSELAHIRQQWEHNLDKLKHIDWQAIVVEQRRKE
jgi:hypothetical protein